MGDPLKPQVEELEPRCCPSTLTAPAALVAQAEQHPAAMVAYAAFPLDVQELANPSEVLFGRFGPSYAQVIQEQVGDCGLLASLASIAARSPAAIEALFTYDGQAVEGGSLVGIWSVRLDGREIAVDTEFPNSTALHAYAGGGTSPVLWVALAEKAFAVIDGDSYLVLNAGNWPYQAYQALLGSGVQTVTSSLPAEWASGDYVTLVTQTPPGGSELVPDHCYAVVSFNSDRGYELYNPWGDTSWMTLAQVERYFYDAETPAANVAAYFAEGRHG
jgi:Calpain family cysteine protease